MLLHESNYAIRLLLTQYYVVLRSIINHNPIHIIVNWQLILIIWLRLEEIRAIVIYCLMLWVFVRSRLVMIRLWEVNSLFTVGISGSHWAFMLWDTARHWRH